MENITITNPNENLRKIFSFKEWRQRIHLFDDLYTPGTRCEYEWESCFLPTELKGKSFLDVGSNDGMMSFLAEKKGAFNIKSVDLYVEDDATNLNMVKGWSLNRVKTIKEIKRSAIKVEPCSIYDLNSLGDKFDIVYCGNVIAWLSDPVEALKQLSSVTKDRLIIREDISRIENKPLLEYINNDALSGCMFNGNKSFYEKILKSLGFKKITFKPVDEFRIYEQRYIDFKKYDIPQNSTVFSHPFESSPFYQLSNKQTAQGSMLINGKLFFNYLGWIDKNAVSVSPIDAIPKNSIKKLLYKRKFKKTAQFNCMIFCEK